MRFYFKIIKTTGGEKKKPHKIVQVRNPTLASIKFKKTSLTYEKLRRKKTHEQNLTPPTCTPPASRSQAVTPAYPPRRNCVSKNC